MTAPVLAAGDGALGFWKAVREVFLGPRRSVAIAVASHSTRSSISRKVSRSAGSRLSARVNSLHSSYSFSTWDVEFCASRTAATMASVTARVPAVPPTSLVLTPAASVLLTPRRISFAPDAQRSSS